LPALPAEEMQVQLTEIGPIANTQENLFNPE